MGINNILDAKADKDLISKSVIDIQSVFVSSVTINTRSNSSFISGVNKILQDKYATHKFHFIHNTMIKKPHLWKDSLHLNLSGKYQLMNNFCEKLKDGEVVTYV